MRLDVDATCGPQEWCDEHENLLRDWAEKARAYSWLHKGMYGCAYDLGVKNHYWKQQRRDPPYVRYCVHRAQMLRHFGVTPVIVFDGDRLPAKGGEEKERRDRRAECMRKGHEKMAVGDKDGAAFFFAQGLDVTPAMAHELIAALKREVEALVADFHVIAPEAATHGEGPAKPGRKDGGYGGFFFFVERLFRRFDFGNDLSFPNSARFDWDWRAVPASTARMAHLGVRRLRESLATENAVVGAATALVASYTAARLWRAFPRGADDARDEAVRF